MDIYSDECGPTSFLCRYCANKLKRLDKANSSVSELNSYFQNLFHGREVTLNNEKKRRLHDTSFEVKDVTRKSFKHDDPFILDSERVSSSEKNCVSLFNTQLFRPTDTVEESFKPGQLSQALTINDLCKVSFKTKE